MPCKFDKDDIIKYRGYKAIVKDTRYDFLFNKYELIIKFKNEKLIPNEMNVFEDDEEVVLVQKNDICPLCDTQYKVTRSPVLNEAYYDCLKCGMRREDIEEVVKSKKSVNTTNPYQPWWEDDDFDIPF